MMQADSPNPGPLPPDVPRQVAAALAEDVGSGDVTASLVPADTLVEATIVAREAAVICGNAWADEAFRQVSNDSLAIDWLLRDGDGCEADQILCRIAGPARPLLTAERTALNFLQTLSGTATAARRYAARLADTPCRLLDTRKTLPGLRTAQKYAVRCGGGTNHRIGLFDGILVKENHIAAAGGIAAAVHRARETRASLAVEVEVEDLAQLDEAIAAGADLVLLDNFSPEQLAAAVARTRAATGTVRLEASGGISLDDLARVAATGVDFVSVGAVTKHVRAVDLSLRIVRSGPAQDVRAGDRRRPAARSRDAAR
jgi:nicotinate-nucleotide pyrophosphorylase (carboxylating)